MTSLNSGAKILAKKCEVAVYAKGPSLSAQQNRTTPRIIDHPSDLTRPRGRKFVIDGIESIWSIQCHDAHTFVYRRNDWRTCLESHGNVLLPGLQRYAQGASLKRSAHFVSNALPTRELLGRPIPCEMESPARTTSSSSIPVYRPIPCSM